MGGVSCPSHASYLARLDAALVGPRRARRSLLAEVADHLEDATDALVEAGLDRAEAEQRAVADFGDVAEVAPDFQTVLAAASSRRTATLLLLALGLQPFLWDRGLGLAAATHVSAPDTWLYAALDQAVELTGALVLVGAVLALLANGVGGRWVGYGRPVARATATLSLVGASAMPALCVSMTAMTQAGPAFWALVAVLMLAPMAGVALSARRTLAAA